MRHLPWHWKLMPPLAEEHAHLPMVGTVLVWRCCWDVVGLVLAALHNVQAR
jgi:hypothetical protein